MLALFARKVLQMDDVSPAGVFAQVGAGVFPGYLDPAGVHFGFQNIGGHFLVEDVQRVFAVQLHKFEVVVVIAQLHAQRLGLFAQQLRAVDHFLEFGLAGAIFLGQIGDHDKFAADVGIHLQHAVRIVHHIHKGNVSGQGNEADFLAQTANFLGGMAEQTGELDRIIAQRLYLAQGSFKVLFQIVTDGIQLQTNGKIHSDFSFSQVDQISGMLISTSWPISLDLKMPSMMA